MSERFEDYESSDSDEDYDENEKRILKNLHNRQENASDSSGDEEIYKIRSNEDDSNEDSDDQSDIALSDVEGQDDEEGLPNAQAWGKDKRKFYYTDYVDPDYGTSQGKDAHRAELEGEESKKLRDELAQQFYHQDFSLDMFLKKTEKEEDKISVDEGTSDISKLSKKQILQLLEKKSPEFFALVKDFKDNMTILKEFIGPFISHYKNQKIKECPATEFVLKFHELILGYCVNIHAYLLFKSTKINIQNHPVLKRLVQFRQLLSQMLPVFEDTIKPQIEILLLEIEKNDDSNKSTNKKKRLNILSKPTNKEENTKVKRKMKPLSSVENEKLLKKAKVSQGDTLFADSGVEDETSDYKEGQFSQETEQVEKNEDTVEKFVEDMETGKEIIKRAITYEMKKNKGLTPHRKKEQRNPRVKHRNKFRKAKIRRKGAVREPRTELRRYGGEISGIKASVTKSIKIKT